jgi:DNA-binding MarR family transcriptional regulator
MTEDALAAWVALNRRDRDYLLGAARAEQDHDECPSQSDVGRAAPVDGLERTTTSRALRSLAQKGLVTCHDKVPDGRSTGVRVTDRGYQTLSAARDALASVVNDE